MYDLKHDFVLNDLHDFVAETGSYKIGSELPAVDESWRVVSGLTFVGGGLVVGNEKWVGFDNFRQGLHSVLCAAAIATRVATLFAAADGLE